MSAAPALVTLLSSKFTTSKNSLSSSTLSSLKPTFILLAAVATCSALISNAVEPVANSLVYFTRSSPAKFILPPPLAIFAIFSKLSPSSLESPLISFFSFSKFSSLSSTYFLTLAKAASSSMASFIGTAMTLVFKAFGIWASSLVRFDLMLLKFSCKLFNLALSREPRACLASFIVLVIFLRLSLSVFIWLRPLTARPIPIPTDVSCICAPFCDTIPIKRIKYESVFTYRLICGFVLYLSRPF